MHCDSYYDKISNLPSFCYLYRWEFPYLNASFWNKTYIWTLSNQWDDKESRWVLISRLSQIPNGYYWAFVLGWWISIPCDLKQPLLIHKALQKYSQTVCHYLCYTIRTFDTLRWSSWEEKLIPIWLWKVILGLQTVYGLYKFVSWKRIRSWVLDS